MVIAFTLREGEGQRDSGQEMNVMVAVACMPSAAMVPSRSCSVF
jgi:hypothetical protein